MVHLCQSYSSNSNIMIMKIPESISALVYYLKYPWIWIILIWIIALLGLCTMVPFNQTYEIIAFLSCSCLGFVGAMPLISTEKNKEHYFLAIIAGVLSQIWVLLVNPKVLIIWLGYLLLMCFPQLRSKWCLLVEIFCLLSVVLTLLNIF